jgi:hypothetical protein
MNGCVDNDLATVSIQIKDLKLHSQRIRVQHHTLYDIGM